jgi:hypothetical protein
LELFEEPYKYVIDTSALIDLKKDYPPEVFRGLWDKFNQLVRSRVIISVREVYNEVKKGSDFLLDWVDKYESCFLYPTAAELAIVGRLQNEFEHLVDYNSDRPNADPLVIASAETYKIKIIQHEQVQSNKHKIPFVAKQLGLTCIRLPELFLAEGWQFN